MAQVPYDHIEAPTALRIDGVPAYQPGDPVPISVAQRLGLLDADGNVPTDADGEPVSDVVVIRGTGYVPPSPDAPIAEVHEGVATEVAKANARRTPAGTAVTTTTDKGEQTNG